MIQASGKLLVVLLVLAMLPVHRAHVNNVLDCEAQHYYILNELSYAE